MNFILMSIQFLVFQFLLRFIVLLLKAGVKAIIYSPQLFTAYVLSNSILKKEESILVWFIFVLLVAVLIYQCILLLKSIMHKLKDRGSWLWPVILVLLISYTCILPVWFSFNTVYKVMCLISVYRAGMLTVLFSVVMGSYIYSRYRFMDI